MRFTSMTFVALTLMGAVRSIRQDVLAVDQISMIQLPLQQVPLQQGDQVPSRVAELQTTLPTMCRNELDWATTADCDLSKKLVDFIIAQNGGPTGDDMDVAKRVATVQLMVYGPPGALLTAYDTDSSGNLSMEEIRPAIRADLGLPEASVASIMALFDGNNDGTLVRSELYQFGRACLVVRQFLRDIDSIAPTVDSVDLLPALDTNLLHLPESSLVNLKWHSEFQLLSANLTAECHTLKWATEEDCEHSQALMKVFVNLPTWNTSSTLETAQTLAQLATFLHIPDQFAIGMLDADGDRAFTHSEYIDNSGLMQPTLGMGGVETLFALVDANGDGRATREEVYAFTRGALVIRHFIPDLDPVSPGRLKDGSSTLLDETALNMALHLIDPPPVPRAKMESGPKLLSVFGIMLAAFTIQWFCCGAKPRVIESNDEKDVK